MKRRNELSLKDVLDLLVQDRGWQAGLDEQAIRTAWPELAGAMIARHTLEVRLCKDELRVRVDSAPLRQELTYMRGALIELVNRHLGRAVVKELRLL